MKNDRMAGPDGDGKDFGRSSLPLTKTIRKPSSYFFYDCFNSFFGQNVGMCFHATRPVVFSDRFSISMVFGRKVHGIYLYRSFKDFPWYG